MSTDTTDFEAVRAESVRRGRWLEYLTIAWNSLEGHLKWLEFCLKIMIPDK